MRVLIIGSGRVGREVATRLEGRGENVVVIENVKTVVAATGDDKVNLFVGQQAATNFDVGRVVCRANHPDNPDAFEDLDVEIVSSTHATAQAIDNSIERPAMARWTDMLAQGGELQEVTLGNESFVGSRECVQSSKALLCGEWFITSGIGAGTGGERARQRHSVPPPPFVSIG